MSPSTPARNKPRIPFQPNPFGSAAYGSPWAGEPADVPSINGRPFELILAELGQMRAGAKGSSIVLVGEPGSGKTHLLGRLRARLQQDEREGKGATVYIYVRSNASAATLWRHLQHALASDLLRGPEASQLQAVFQRDQQRADKVGHGALRHVLECLRDGRHFHAAAAWLRGEQLGESDLAALGLAVEKDDEDQGRERDAMLVVMAILRFLAPTPVVICFDQVEALESYHGELAGYHAMGRLISELNDGNDHLLLISCIVSAFEHRFDQLSNGADRDRWLQYKAVLRPIGWEPALELVQARLDAAIPLQAARLAHASDPLWPLDEMALKPLFAATGLCLPRTLIQACKQQFDALMPGDAAPVQPVTLAIFLRDAYNRNLAEARRTATKQGLSKTLSDCLPWLLQNSRMMPLGRDEARSRYASQAWRGANGDIALAFCDGRGNALTNQFKRIDREWNPKILKLAILRDPAVQPGARGAELLVRLKERGAREVHPLPEALAVLQAIRNLAATARSGELFWGDQIVSEPEVTDWALSHLPQPVEELRTALTGHKIPDDDPILPRLLELVVADKIVAAEAAAQRLGITTEEVRECARRHPMRFGLLDGAPVVVFEAAGAPAR